MNGFGSKTFVIAAMKIKSVALSGVVQVGDSHAVLPHIDAIAAGGPRGAASFNTQTFPRSRTRFHLANLDDEEKVGDLSIVTPAPDREQITEIQQRIHTGKEIFQRFEAEGNTMCTTTQKRNTIQQIEINSILTSGVVHIGNTRYVMPVIHSRSRGIVAGTVVGAGGPVGAIGG